MSFAQDNGYTPQAFSALINQLREGINEQFQTSYTESSFVGSNWYKYLYAPTQMIAQLETKTAEIFFKLSQYIHQTNLRIQRPSVSLPGLIESFAAKGFVVSVRKMTAENRGLQGVCVDVDDSAPDYADKRKEICTHLSQFGTAGIVTEGTEVESITLDNGQSFDFKFYLPNYIDVQIRVTFTVSENNLLLIPDDIELREQVMTQILARYRLGWDFEPQKYITTDDCPWASEVLLEYSEDGLVWESAVYTASFQDLFRFGLEDIAIVIND